MYIATRPILYMPDGRAWSPGQVVPLSTVSSAVAEAWKANGVVKEVEEEEKPRKRGRPRKEDNND